MATVSSREAVEPKKSSVDIPQQQSARTSWIQQSWLKYQEGFWLTGILLLAVALRIYRIGATSYWADEVHNLLKSDYLGSVLLKGELVSNHPPLFTILLTIWRTMGMDGGEWQTRLLPALLSVAATGAVYGLGRRLFNPRVGLMAAFLLAVSPYHVLHAQEVKEYAILPLTGTVMICFLHRSVEENRKDLWAGYAIMAGLACYSESFAGPLLVGLNVWAVYRMSQLSNRWKPWFVANLAGFLLFAPYLPIMLKKVNEQILSSGHWWIPRPTPLSLLVYLKTLAFGYSDLAPHYGIALAFYLVFAAAGITIAWRRARSAAVLLCCWFVLPVLLVYGISHVTKSIFLLRALNAFSIAFYLMAGLAWATVPRRWLRAALTVCFAGIAIFPLKEHYQKSYALHEFPHRGGIHAPLPYREATAFVKQHWQEGDVLVHSSISTWLPFYWYGLNPRLTHTVGTDSGLIKAVQDLNHPTTDREIWQSIFIHHIQPVVEGERRIWMVFAEYERQYYSENPLMVWRWLNAHYAEILHKNFEGLELFCFAGDAYRPQVRIVQRDEDDGVSALLSYQGGIEAAYRKVLPDSGLVPKPITARRGKLTLRFTDTADINLPLGEQQGTGRRVCFAIENRSDAEARCRIEVVSSDCLVPLASLYAADPDLGVWNVTPMWNKPQAPAYYEAPAATAHLFHQASAALDGTMDLAPGAYVTSTYYSGKPGALAPSRAPVTIEVAGQRLTGPEEYSETAEDGWRWVETGRALIDRTPVQICITAKPVPEGTDTWFSLGYIAFRRADENRGTPQPARWVGNLTAAPHRETSWSAQVDPHAARVDIWVYESGENGRVYHLFKDYAGRDASSTQGNDGN
jgi:mannosyltransferase